MSGATWRKIMSNGALGEARVRALLLERFDVLTRSVDADGADFLIQLRSSGRFSDELAPRLGIIQAKFAQDTTTTHLVPVEYAIASGQTIEEFFVLVTVGHEDEAKNYLISAEDLTQVTRTKRDGKEFYSLAAKDRKVFLQKRISTMLNTIERSLKERTDKQNERFYQKVTIPDFPVKRASLESKWFLPIPNEAGFIPDLVYQLRHTLRVQLYALDDFTAAVTKLLTSMMADECAASVKAVIDDRAHEQSGGDEFLRFGPFQLLDTQKKLIEAIKLHETRMQNLERTRQLDRFVSAAKMILDHHVSFNAKHMHLELVRVDKNRQTVSTKHARTTLTIDPITMEVTHIMTELVSNGNYDKVRGSSEIIRSRQLWRYTLDEGTVATWRELDRLRHLLLADLYQLMCPKDAVSAPVLPLYMAE